VRFREAASASDIGSGAAALAKLDWKAALGYLNVNSRASFKTRDYDLRSLLPQIDKIEVDWQLRGNDSLFLSITHGLLLR
jgi:hypothetical protein